MNPLNESTINILAEGTKIEGKTTFDHVSRVHGVLLGEVLAKEGSTLILSEVGVIEGNIHADTLMIDGYVRGDIFAKSRVVISRNGRVIGNIQNSVPGSRIWSHFEGKCSMAHFVPSPLAARKHLLNARILERAEEAKGFETGASLNGL
jgi:cytoskeletal protein CcmA (bactofilin family)